MNVIAPAAMLALLIGKLTDWVKSVVPGQMGSTLLIPLSIIIAVFVTLAFGQSPILAKSIHVFEGLSLHDADIWARLLWGACIGAGAGTVYDLANRKTSENVDDNGGFYA